MASRNPTMTLQESVAKWRPSTLKERSGSQEDFIDLCRGVGSDLHSWCFATSRQDVQSPYSNPLWHGPLCGSMHCAMAGSTESPELTGASH